MHTASLRILLTRLIWSISVPNFFQIGSVVLVWLSSKQTFNVITGELTGHRILKKYPVSFSSIWSISVPNFIEIGTVVLAWLSANKSTNKHRYFQVYNISVIQLIRMKMVNLSEIDVARAVTLIDCGHTKKCCISFKCLNQLFFGSQNANGR